MEKGNFINMIKNLNFVEQERDFLPWDTFCLGRIKVCINDNRFIVFLDDDDFDNHEIGSYPFNSKEILSIIEEFGGNVLEGQKPFYGRTGG